MNRFFVSRENIKEKEAVIDNKEDVKHISKVLRLQEGESVILSDGEGYEYICLITDIDKSTVYVSIKEKLLSKEDDKVKIFLYQGMPKGSKLEYIVQKCIELGADEITPVIMDRSINHDRGKSENKIKRYEKIAESAAKQSHRSFIPKVRSPLNFDVILDELDRFDLVIFPYENEDNLTIKSFMENIEHIDSIKDVAIIIGPEGGFSQIEVEKLEGKGIVPVTLGKTILRTETAGVSVISMINYALNL